MRSQRRAPWVGWGLTVGLTALVVLGSGGPFWVALLIAAAQSALWLIVYKWLVP